MTEIVAKTLPRLGDTAPNFTAPTTYGSLNFHDWKAGKWTVLFSHPADFTPVCSTELTEFAKRKQDFDSRNCSMMGISIDSIHAHLAWVQNLKQVLDVELNFPLVADLTADVAREYGMIHPGESETVTVRTLFVIDPNNKVRATIYYPLNVGRNVDEVLRLVDGLQMADKNAVACPVNWRPGDDVIVPPPKTMDDVAQRMNSDYERLDFYLCKKTV